MKLSKKADGHRFCALIVAVSAAVGSATANATVIDWKQQTVGTNDWATDTNWVGSIAPTDDLTTDIARFNATNYSKVPTVGIRSISGIQIGDGTTVTAILTIAGTQLNLGVGGITMAANAGAATINPGTVVATSSQTWSNSSTKLLSIGQNAAGGTSLTPGSSIAINSGSVLTLNTATGSTITLNGMVNNGSDVTGGAPAGSIVISGGGNVNLNYVSSVTVNSVATPTASQTFTGGVTVGTGSTLTIAFSCAGLTNASGITVDGGTINLNGNSVTTALGTGSFTITDKGATITRTGGSGMVFGLTSQIWNGDLTVTGTAGPSLGGAVTLSGDRSVTTGTGTVLTLTGAIGESAPGASLTKKGVGTLVLSGAATHTFTGDLNIQEGTLNFSSSSSNLPGALKINTGATTNINNAGLTISVGGLSDGSTGGGTFSNSSSGTSTLNLTGAGNYTFSGLITNAATKYLNINKNGAGTQIFSNANTYSGTTTINNGLLKVTNTSGSATGTGAVTVGDGTNNARLGGNGIVNGAVTVKNKAGIDLSGDGTGTLTFGAALTLQTGSILTFDLGTAGAEHTAPGLSDMIALTGSGNLTLNTGMSLVIASGSENLIDTGSYKLLSYAGNVLIGSTTQSASKDITYLFTSITGTSGANVNVMLDTASKAIWLDYTAAPVPEPATAGILATCAGALLIKRRRK